MQKLTQIIVITAVISIITESALAQSNSPPVVSGVTAVQKTDDSKVIEIHYNLTDPENNTCTVWVMASNDGAPSWRVPVKSVWGDVGPGITPNGAKSVIWDAGGDVPGMAGSFKVRVYADDGHSAEDLAFIPGGEFWMGDPFNDGSTNEKPRHLVLVDPYMMGKYEVTNQQYCEYLNHAKLQNKLRVVTGVVYAYSDFSHTYPFCSTREAFQDSQITYNGEAFSVIEEEMRDHPMVAVSWYGAAAYCNWRSEQQGLEACFDPATWTCNFGKNGFRLPTEAEWECAARGGEYDPYYRFPWGDTISHSQANYRSYWTDGSPSYSYDVSPTEGYHPTYNDGIQPYTSPVGSFAANGYGLFDMAGNVFEMCYDWYKNDYYSDANNYNNPKGPSSGTYRVIRGGSWADLAYYCRVAALGFPPSNRHYYFGFRLVLDVN